MITETGAELDAVEEVDGTIVVGDVRPLPERSRTREIAVVNTVIAVTGFVAGAAAAVVVSQRRARRAAAQSAPRRTGNAAANVFDVEATRSFLVDVHVLSKRP
jgi:hypothetical protein